MRVGFRTIWFVPSGLCGLFHLDLFFLGVMSENSDGGVTNNKSKNTSLLG